jgi:hypothetical protein
VDRREQHVVTFQVAKRITGFLLFIENLAAEEILSRQVFSTL